jgi:RNA polymerase sigma factor (sigma-70 family)
MVNSFAAPLLRYVRGLGETSLAGERPDRELVERFADQHDEAAFAALVGRHGPMVLGVCRRVLDQEQDAEDVFQAVFLVLSRKAGGLRRKEAVGPWLFGVAHRLALRVRQEARQRREREGRARGRPASDPLAELTVREAQAVLDEELARLPDRDRGPLVLCYLEGLTRDEAARRLGCPLGTLKDRLERGRALLRKRLVRRGLTLAAFGFSFLLPGASARAVPGSLQAATVRAATAFAAGSMAGGAVCARAAALAKTVLGSLFVGKLKGAVAVLLATVACGAGVGLAAHWVAASDGARRTAAVQERQPGGRPDGAAGRVEAAGAPSPPANEVRPGAAAWRLHAELVGHEGPVRALAFSPDGTRIISGGDDGRVRVWHVAGAREVLNLRGRDARTVRAVAIDPSGHVVAAGSDDGTVLAWDLRRGGDQAPDVVFPAAGQAVHALCFGADCGTVTRVWCDGTVERKEGPAAVPLCLAGQEGKVHGVALGREGRTAAWAMQDGSVRLWDPAERKEHGHFGVHASPVRCVAFSPEGDVAASADDLATLKVWDTATGRERATARGPQGPVRALALGPGGRFLASGGEDHTVRVWDARTGKELAAFHDNSGPVYSVVFSPDGRFLASAGSDGTVRTWTSTPGTAESEK